MHVGLFNLQVVPLDIICSLCKYFLFVPEVLSGGLRVGLDNCAYLILEAQHLRLD